MQIPEIGEMLVNRMPSLRDLGIAPMMHIGPGRRTIYTYRRGEGKRWGGATLRAMRAKNGVGNPRHRKAA